MTQSVTRCDGVLLRNMTTAAFKWLQVNSEAVNALNVFPVPDGDTGTNMMLTMRSAINEIEGKQEPAAFRVASHISRGALMGARGNSGVILSQIWRGLARGLDTHEAFTTRDFALALREATNTAYRGVARPVEGTILTVSRDLADAAETIAADTDDISTMLGRLVDAGHASVARTPDLLPVLKQAGVVDSGGKGLVILLEGMHRYITGQSLDTPTHAVLKTLALDAVQAGMDEVEPGQEWEVVVDFRPQHELDMSQFYIQLEKMGTSIQVGQGDDIIRMHIHLLKTRRYEPIEYCEELGTVVNVHMENLLDQLEQQQANAGGAPSPAVQLEPGQILAVTVSPGPGFSKVFATPGVAIITGGQTMNPSTQDFLAAFEDLPTDRVVLLPNNKNILMAANQAAEVSVKDVRVIPTRTVPQGLAALLAFDPDGDLDEVVSSMQANFESVHTGELTVATRTVELDGVSVTEGHYIGLHNGKLVSAGDSLEGVLLAVLENMDSSDLELVTLFYGQPTNAETADEVAALITDNFPNLEVEVYYGGQPHYHFIFSAE